MKLRIYFAIFLLLQLPAYAAMLWITFGSRPTLFYASEALLVVLAAFSVVFYRRIMRPVDTLAGGMNLLRSQDWNVALRHQGQPEVDSLVDVFNTMMEHMRNQRIALEEQRHFLSLLVREAPLGIIVKDFDQRDKLVNPAAQHLLDSFPDLQRRLSTMTDGTDTNMRLNESTMLHCIRRHFIDCGVKQSFYIIENIAETVAVAERDAYVKLIRLMAHEVNNTVAGLSTALGTVAPDPDGLLAACRERALELSAFIGRFSEVVKTPAPQKSIIDPGALIRRSAPFLESLCSPRGILLNFDVSRAAPSIEVDEVQISQVLVNVVKNAAESIGSDGRVDIIMADNVLTVCDNGPGIAPDKAARMAEPFFTDKDGGQGIGLTFVREVLRRHGCRFSLATGADGITRFSAAFPRPKAGRQYP